MVDALGISIGSLFGSPPVTAYIESGASIPEGGKTGLSVIFTGIVFFISIFFAPIFASIPPGPLDANQQPISTGVTMAMQSRLSLPLR